MKKASRKTGAGLDLYQRQATLFKAFANPTRVHLLDVLGHGEAGASDLQEELGISKANLSQHLSILRAAGVVHTRRNGKKLVCGLSSREVKDAYNHVRTLVKAGSNRRSS